jgi:hypothetical protein
MPEQWLTIRFRGDKELREGLASIVDGFLKKHKVSHLQITRDELPCDAGVENEEEIVGLANNEITIGPID